MNVALILARGGSKSIPRKNVTPVLGRPLVEWPIRAAIESRDIDEVAVSTDCPHVIDIAESLGVRVIERPQAIAHDTAQMVDAVSHALEALGGAIEYLVSMHGNCATHREGLIDECLSRLRSDPEADSCVSGVIDKSIHPFRTRKMNSDGHLEPWADIPEGTSSNRQALEPCVVLDGAARAMRVASCFPPRGFPPFPYLGRRILMVENPGGLDVHDEDDIWLTERYLERHGNIQPDSRG